jgi:hypothetical protein
MDPPKNRYLHQRFVERPGFRAFDEDIQEATFVGKAQLERPRYPQVFSRPITTEDVKLKKVDSMDSNLY